MSTEIKEIGVPIDASSGYFENTVLDGGVLKLAVRGQSNTGTNNYYHQGYWESDPIDIVGKYTSLENLAISATNVVEGSYKAFTRTSTDGQTWTEYVEIDYATGKMLSIPDRYVQIKIELFGVAGDVTEVMNDFADNSEIQGSEFIEANNGLRLKKDYSFEMSLDGSFAGSGEVHRKTINKSDFKKINSIRVE